jgi:hypothetical protein
METPVEDNIPNQLITSIYGSYKYNLAALKAQSEISK